MTTTWKPTGPVFAETPKWRRVTFRGADGKLVRWEGFIRLCADGKLRGEHRTEIEGGEPEDVRLNLLIANPDEILRVEVENPVYERWQRVPWPPRDSSPKGSSPEPDLPKKET